MSDRIDWKICQEAFEPEHNLVNESLFCLANGYIGVRGHFEEPLSSEYSKKGTFINGFYESSTIQYGESAYGFARNMQTMLNVCDARAISLTIDGERFSLEEGMIESFHRELDMENALEVRELVWKSPAGRLIRIVNKHLVCMERKHIAASRYEVTPLDGSCEILWESALDGDIRTGEETDDPRVSGSLGDGDFVLTGLGYKENKGRNMAWVKQSTKRSGLHVVCSSVEQCSRPAGWEYREEKLRTVTRCRVSAQKGSTVSLEKYISYVTSQREDARGYEEKGFSELEKALNDGWDVLLAEQSEYMKHFWECAGVEIIGDETLTKSMRFNIFQLLQSVGKDSHTSIASKGLSGEGYGGHYFWESEAYIAPMFMLADEKIARSMLEYRYHILDQAREQARLMGHKKGALYAWRTIDGTESSAYFPAGSAQYHINADIAFAVYRYADVAEDTDFLIRYGLEILLETARLWIDAGHYSDIKGGQFCIDAVTGPDEYTAIVDNNCYTNVMARENLWNAVKAVEWVREADREACRAVCDRIGFKEEELVGFQQAADRMYIPYDENLGIHMQDDTFLSKKVLNLKDIPDENRPLLLHYHPLFIYRHQVCKQADLVLAEYFLPERFKMEDKKRDYDYYEKITTHDSSLSACVFSVMAAETGNTQKAYDYFIQTVRTDLDDNQKNTKDGLHMANMAGAWSCMLHGFGGLKILDGKLHFWPVLPKEWKGYKFRVKYRGQQVEVEVKENETCYRLKSAGTIVINHAGEDIELTSLEEVRAGMNRGRAEA